MDPTPQLIALKFETEEWFSCVRFLVFSDGVPAEPMIALHREITVQLLDQLWGSVPELKYY